METKIVVFIITLLVFSGMLAFIFFNTIAETTPVADDSGATQEGVASVVEADNQFAFNLYSELKDEGDSRGNIFFSPYSISIADAIAYEGARGQTAEEMQSVFHFPDDAAVRRSSFARIHNIINKRGKQYTLYTANALWAEQSYKFLDEYTGTIEKYYAGKTANLDFINDVEASRQIINEWVERQTNNKIKDLFQPGTLDDTTRLVITNAIYFKGKWAKQFDKANTREEDFRTISGNTVKVQMMRLTEDEAKFNYTETDDLQVLELPYEGGTLSMLVLLPKGDDLSSLENSLNAQKLSNLRKNLNEEKVHVYLPKFTFDTKYTLNENLKDMGMITAFKWPGADFSGMDGTKDLYIAIVVHQAFVEVNEEGTEAAAATGISMTLGAAVQQFKEFRADHPFIFLIQERETGNILFLGRVVNPS